MRKKCAAAKLKVQSSCNIRRRTFDSGDGLPKPFRKSIIIEWVEVAMDRTNSPQHKFAIDDLNPGLDIHLQI